MTYQYDPILGQGRDGAVSLAEQQKGFDAGSSAAKAAFQSSVSGYLAIPPALVKSNSAAPAFSVSLGSLVVGQGVTVIVPGGIKSFAANGAITAISYTAGTDYVVSCNGTALAIEAYRTGSDVVGGFHYSLAGAINPYSIWDTNYKPSALSPRGMVIVNGNFWADIYLCGVDHYTNGTSKSGVQIADGLSPPKIPSIYGGNGTTTYATFNWYAACEILAAAGKRMPSYLEFSALAYGVTEQTSRGTDPVTTQSDAPRKSSVGVEQATGNMFIYGGDVYSYNETGATWQSITVGRGQVYTVNLRVPIFGGAWDGFAQSGSRCSHWGLTVTQSDQSTGIRGVSGHFQI
jgi:hypothetical protein